MPNAGLRCNAVVIGLAAQDIDQIAWVYKVCFFSDSVFYLAEQNFLARSWDEFLLLWDCTSLVDGVIRGALAPPTGNQRPKALDRTSISVTS